jgi:hypothetical protein
MDYTYTSFIMYPHYYTLPASTLLNYDGKRHSRPYDVRLDEASYLYLMKKLGVSPQSWIPIEMLISRDTSAVGLRHMAALSGVEASSPHSQPLSINTSGLLESPVEIKLSPGREVDNFQNESYRSCINSHDHARASCCGPGSASEYQENAFDDRFRIANRELSTSYTENTGISDDHRPVD